jgi:hypothetical protein
MNGFRSSLGGDRGLDIAGIRDITGLIHGSKVEMLCHKPSDEPNLIYD